MLSLAAYQAHGMGLPLGVTTDIFNAASSLAVHQELQLGASSANMTRLRVGRLLGRLVSSMQKAAQVHAIGNGNVTSTNTNSANTTRGTANSVSVNTGINGSVTKLQLYFAHDSTLWPLWAALGVMVPLWPGYASVLTFELHASSSVPQQHVFEVRAFRNFGSQLAMRACPGPCTLAAFVDAMGPFTLSSADDAREACTAAP
jgi:hypothetical protein